MWSQSAETLNPDALESRAVADDRRLRVVHVVPTLNTGGQEMLCAQFVERADPARFQSSVIALQGGGWLSRRLEEHGYPVHCLGYPDGFRPDLVFKVAGLLRRMRADVVHCHNQKGYFYGGLAALLAPGARVVLTKHGRSSLTESATAPIVRFLLRRVGAVVAVSADVRQILSEMGTIAPDRLHVVLNGVDTDEFKPGGDRTAARAALGIPQEALVVGTVARLAPEKDQATLLRAFARVRQEIPAARLVLAGDGPLRGELESLAAELGIEGSTHFLGERKDVASVLPALDVFSLPSRSEGTPLTVLEAMASGLPVVATRVGGLPEVVTEGRSGLLVPPGQPDELAAALGRVLRDPAVGREMGVAGREIVQARYSMAAMMDQYAALYEQVSGRANGGASTGADR